MKFILGKKIEMSQRFQDEKVLPVTLIEAGPCFVIQVKAKEGRVQLGFEKLKEKKVKKPQKGKPYRHLREFQTDVSQYKIGDEIRVEIFKPGEKVNVSGISKGKGFAGVVKRWGFKGMPATHGTKHDLRHPGSIGATAPQRVFKGKKMAGRMGGKRVTVKNLEIIEVNPEKNLLVVGGAVPGARDSLVEIVAK